MTKTDFLVIGGGILGISVARELKKRFKDCGVILLEKENELALHGSGRNSGVLHAGFYYTANSLKAKLTREGNRSLTEYCDQKKLKIHVFFRLRLQPLKKVSYSLAFLGQCHHG